MNLRVVVQDKCYQPNERDIWQQSLPLPLCYNRRWWVEVFPSRSATWNLTLKWNSHRYLSDMTSENTRHGGDSEEQAKVPGFGWSGRTIFQGLKTLLKFWHVIITHRRNKQRSHPKIAYTLSMCVCFCYWYPASGECEKDCYVQVQRAKHKGNMYCMLIVAYMYCMLIVAYLCHILCMCSQHVLTYES